MGIWFRRGEIHPAGVVPSQLILFLLLACSLGEASGKGFAVADLGELVDLTDSSGGDCVGFCWDPIFIFPGIIAMIFQVVAAVGQSIYLPTLEGSLRVAAKAKERAMRFISPEDEPRDVPASGRYKAQYKEVSEWKVATYNLKFDASGIVEGLCVDEDGQFKVYGQYNAATGGFTWAEYPLNQEDYIINTSPSEIDYFIRTARPFHTEVEVKLGERGDIMEGLYHASSDITGAIILQLQHPFFHEFAASDFATDVVSSGVMSTTYVASTSEASTPSQDYTPHERLDSAEDMPIIKKTALLIEDSAGEQESDSKAEIQPISISSPRSKTTTASEIEPCISDDERIGESRQRLGGVGGDLSPPVIEKYGLVKSGRSTSNLYRGILNRLMSNAGVAPKIMQMDRNQEDMLTERLLDGV